MKSYYGLVGACLLFVSTSCLALMPPTYLSIPRWKSCVSTMRQGSAKFVCLPDNRPRGCPRSSWDALDDDDSIESCS